MWKRGHFTHTWTLSCLIMYNFMMIFQNSKGILKWLAPWKMDSTSNKLGSKLGLANASFRIRRVVSEIRLTGLAAPSGSEVEDLRSNQIIRYQIRINLNHRSEICIKAKYHKMHHFH
jgi:hypothetical protein